MGARPISRPGYTLYGRPGAGSSSVEVLLTLTGVDHAVIDVSKADDEALARLRGLNPLVEVPTLVLPSGEVMTESAAMMILLSDLRPDLGLAPPPASPLRPRFLRLIAYLAANVYPTCLRYYYPDRYTADEAGAAAVKAAATSRNEREWAHFAAEVGHGPFALGETLSAVDLYATMLMDWASDRKALFARHPALAAIAHAVVTDPKSAPVWERHGVLVP